MLSEFHPSVGHVCSSCSLGCVRETWCNSSESRQKFKSHTPGPLLCRAQLGLWSGSKIFPMRGPGQGPLDQFHSPQHSPLGNRLFSHFVPLRGEGCGPVHANLLGLGLQRELRGQEPLLLLQKTRVWFSAPTLRGSQPFVISAPGHLSLGPPWASTRTYSYLHANTQSYTCHGWGFTRVCERRLGE